MHQLENSLHDYRSVVLHMILLPLAYHELPFFNSDDVTTISLVSD